jgi:cytochrome oxidase Cu insertion factor (SCO1/SenC/PrrC family)
VIKFLLIFLSFASLCKAQQLIDRPEEFISPNLVIEDEKGVSRELKEFSAQPFLILPVFARCRTSCPLIVEKLIHDLTLSGYPVDTFRVLVFSFDSNDTNENLKEFRRLNRIPPLWMIARATPEATVSLMRSIGVRTIEDGTSAQFSHADLVAVVGPGLWNLKYILRSEMSPEKMSQELRAATEHSKGLSKDVLSFLFPVAILGSLVSIFFLSLIFLKQTNMFKSYKASRVCKYLKSR